MSTSLYWKPPRDYDIIGKDLKYVLGPKLWDQDGTCGTDWTTVDEGLIPFLEGAIAAASNTNVIKEAKELIKLIKKYGAIEIALMT